jgi:hypothetical protein
MRGLPGLARRHRLATGLLAAGLVLRLLCQVSYGPALIYIDTVKYLYGAWPGADPLGYDVPLKLILAVGNLSLVEAVQHLVGLAMAVIIYLLLIRRRVPRWLSALAMAPVLLDAYQLQMETTIMPDVWFEAVIVAGAAILLWRTRVSAWTCVAPGRCSACPPRCARLARSSSPRRYCSCWPAPCWHARAGGGRACGRPPR